MTKLNMNREVPLAEPSAELQRLRTHNTLLLETLRELYEYELQADAPCEGDRPALERCMKHCKKVIG